MSGDEWLASVAERMKKEFEDGTVPTPERLTAQELAGKYGYALRGPWINSRIPEPIGRVEPTFRARFFYPF